MQFVWCLVHPRYHEDVGMHSTGRPGNGSPEVFLFVAWSLAIRTVIGQSVLFWYVVYHACLCVDRKQLYSKCFLPPVQVWFHSYLYLGSFVALWYNYSALRHAKPLFSDLLWRICVLATVSVWLLRFRREHTFV